jgi:hypothetical protein
VIADFAQYARWLAQQPDAELQTEFGRLQALPQSPNRDLRLALLHGQRSSMAYDPQLAASLLIELATNEPESSAHAQLAQILTTGQPAPNACQDNDRLNRLSTDLAAQLVEEQQDRQEAQTQLQTARTELETERAERSRLEKQLKALKSLEAQIKGRDNTTSQ